MHGSQLQKEEEARPLSRYRVLPIIGENPDGSKILVVKNFQTGIYENWWAQNMNVPIELCCCDCPANVAALRKVRNDALEEAAIRADLFNDPEYHKKIRFAAIEIAKDIRARKGKAE